MLTRPARKDFASRGFFAAPKGCQLGPVGSPAQMLAEQTDTFPEDAAWRGGRRADPALGAGQSAFRIAWRRKRLRKCNQCGFFSALSIAAITREVVQLVRITAAANA
jgi:hypothetical protein